ncbi:MAG TPA: ADP-ribosyltransferase [Gemmata sp.]
MSYFSAYVMTEGEPQDGPDIASNSGWASWSEWVLSQADQYPEAAHLAQEGWLDGAEDLAGLEHDLEQLVHDATTNPNLTGVTAQVLAALRSRPEGALGLIVTDGEGGEGDEDALDEHIGLTEDGETWFSEELYQQLLATGAISEALDKSNKKLIDVPAKGGGTVKRWVRVGAKPNAPTPKPGKDPNAHGVITAVMADPSSVDAKDLKDIGDILMRLSKEQIREHIIKAGLNVTGPKQQLADRLLGHLTPQVPPEPITGTAGGKPSRHVDANGQPSAHYRQENPHANAQSLGDPDCTGNPNPKLPDHTRPSCPDVAIAKFVNNYTWGYDAPMNAALRNTGLPPPGDYGGNNYGKPAKSGPAMFAAIRGQFAKARAFGPPPITVGRGITVSGQKAGEMLAEAQAALASGGTVRLGGFVSTSTGNAFPGNVKYTIEAIHGLDVRAYSHFPNESELLLNHGCEYKVLKAERIGSTVHLHFQQVTTGV